MNALLLIALLALASWAQDDPCADNCVFDARCAWVEGECRITESAHCRNSGLCAVDGLCTLLDGACVAGGPDDCAQSQACQFGGQCSYADGACVHSQAACAENDLCREDGRCHEQGDACVALGDADCQQADSCRSHGACFEVDGRCSATATSCVSSQACMERGRCERAGEWCATPAEIAESKAREAELDAAAQSLIASVVVPAEGLAGFHDVYFGGGSLAGGVGGGLPSGVTSLDEAYAAGGLDTRHTNSRPHRRLEPSTIACPPEARRFVETSSERDQLVWCALPDGRKKGPELRVYAGGGQRVYTEYLLDQEHGEHVITEADGRVMVLGRFELGREEGEWQSWYIGGDRASRGRYHAGKKQGIWAEWTRDGEESQCDYRDPAVPDVQCVAPRD